MQNKMIGMCSRFQGNPGISSMLHIKTQNETYSVYSHFLFTDLQMASEEHYCHMEALCCN
jgi:hypothetical protein